MIVNNKIDELKNLLNQELKAKTINNDRIIELSQQMANLDMSKVRFSIDAGIIDRLGKELVARQETAVSELVKNAYDADATEVSLIFSDSDKIGGTLCIKDNGDGMTREELVNGFMRISSTSKIHNPVSRNFKRIRAGKKGIGRFAVQRLGCKLTILTQTKDTEKALKLTINWDEYQKDSDLMSISNSLEEVSRSDDNGTQLIIEQLRDKWSLASIKRIYKYVSDIIQPYALSKERIKYNNERIINNQDSGFSTIFYKENADKLLSKIVDEKTEIFKHALAIFNGWIDDSGHGIYSIESEKLNINEIGEIGDDVDDNKVPFSKLKKIYFRAYYFLIDSEFIAKSQITHIRNFLKNQGSIRLYRNGFRVLPYGEPEDDWLNLDLSLRQRSILPSHGNNNFYGLVEMTDENDVFTETSSREGLSDGEELDQLRNFIYRTLMTGVIKIAEKRNIKVTSNQSKDTKGNWEKAEIRIKSIFKTIDELDNELEIGSTDIDKKKKRKRKVNSIKKALEEIESIQKSEENKYIKERSMMRVLSSVGLSIAQFIHEIKYYMDVIKSDINFLINNLEHDTNSLNTVLTLDNNFSSFHTYTSFFDNVVSKNVIRELLPLNMEEVIVDFQKSIQKEALRSGIHILEPEFPIYRVYTKPMHPSEWASILFNFYTNSKKAICRKNSKGKIFIETGEIENMIFLEFSDNGDGVSKDIEEKIFDEFFTTTTSLDFKSINTNTEILGTGLGLKIVKDIVKSYNGKIEVVSPKENFNTTIRIELPKATKKDIKTYDL